MNDKRGGFCVYYNISLPLKIKKIHYFQECINFETKIKDKLCNFFSLYCSCNQCQEDFESFINNFKLNFDSVMVNNYFLTVILGNFNVKLSLWYNNDITAYDSFKIDGVTSQFELQQVIKEPTHFICDFPSLTDLIFTTQPNLLMKSGVKSSLHANCHHHITLPKFSLKIHYPPLYESEVLPKVALPKGNFDQIKQ